MTDQPTLPLSTCGDCAYGRHHAPGLIVCCGRPHRMGEVLDADTPACPWLHQRGGA